MCTTGCTRRVISPADKIKLINQAFSPPPIVHSSSTMLISRQISLIAFHHPVRIFVFDDTLDKNSKKRGICLSDGTRFIETNGVRFVGALLVFLPCLSSSSSSSISSSFSPFRFFFLSLLFRSISVWSLLFSAETRFIHGGIPQSRVMNHTVRLSNENTFSSY